MLLCNLLLKCPIINHTFGQVIISVLLHYYLWPVWKIDWMLPWSQIQNEKRCWDLQTVDVCLELILLQCIWNSSKYLELGGQQQQSKLVFFLYSCFSCWSLNDTFSVRAPVFRLPAARPKQINSIWRRVKRSFWGHTKEILKWEKWPLQSKRW